MNRIQTLDLIILVALLALVIVTAFFFGNDVFEVVFAPLVVYFLWDTRRKMAQLKKKNDGSSAATPTT